MPASNPGGSTYRGPTRTVGKSKVLTGDTLTRGNKRVSSYSDPVTHHVYVYHSTSYWSSRRSSWGGGWYPTYGSALYWEVAHDRFYYHNYLPGGYYYGTPYPVGYQVANGQFVVAHESHWLRNLFIVMIIIAALVALVWAAMWFTRRNDDTRSLVDDF